MTGSVAVAAGTIFTLSLFLTIGLKPLIDAVTHLQYILHIMLITAFTFELNKEFFDSLFKVSNFELFETTDLICDYLPIEENDGISEHFQDTGYDYTDAILNMGVIFLTILAALVLIIMMFLISKFCCFEKVRKYFRM